MLKRLLVANRGEIAVRILRAAAELGIETVAIFAEDDAASLHTRRADEVFPLSGTGAAAYLDVEQIVAAARERRCDAIHPGYGFLSEHADFARHCAEEGITFVGPEPETLAIFGDKTRARALAEQHGVPVPAGTDSPVTLEQARAFLASLAGDAMLIKAVAGGGGRGMRLVAGETELEAAYNRCRSEALRAFGNGELYAEQFMGNVRHIEVQVAGDGSGAVSHLWERECSIQRRHQKLVEIAPCPALSPGLRARLTGDAVRLARAVRYRNLGTFEFLVAADAGDGDAYAFIEANPRLQVEHTVTEEVLDLDLVKLQLRLAAGASLMELGLEQAAIPAPRGFAVQVRINTETIAADGTVRPAGGTLTDFEVPSGRGVRVDSCGYTGYRTNPNFDSLLAKLIGHSASTNFSDAVATTYRALCEFKVEGVRTNIPFLQNLLQPPDFVADRIYTRFVDEQVASLVAPDQTAHRRLFFDQLTVRAGAGAKIDAVDPLAVLAYGKSGAATASLDSPELPRRSRPYDAAPEGSLAVTAPMQATVVNIDVREGDLVHGGQLLLVLNAMKMEHVIQAGGGGVVLRLAVAPGETVMEDEPLLYIEAREIDSSEAAGTGQIDLDRLRPDLSEVQRRHEITLDATRPEAVTKRRSQGQRTARQNIAELCDPDTFVEYGSLAIAAQRQRRSMEDLIQNTAADGLVAGTGSVNGELFGEAGTQCVVLSYDYMVLAGTQGSKNHAKKDRMFELAERLRLPVVFFTEGGGGRPGDTDNSGVAGLDTMAFHLFGRLSGLVPLVGITSGRCFAGNAALLGCCDVVIATANANIGMGGPAMIEGGGLGVFRPEEVGPMSVQVPNGVVDIVVADEAEAVETARRYLSYFQGGGLAVR